MEEELNENDLEERLYAMLHHVDESEGNLTSNQKQSDGLLIFENALKSTVRRYWRTSEPTTPYQKVTTLKEPLNTPLNNNKQPDLKQTNQTAKPKEEKSDLPELPHAVDLSIFQTPVSQNIKRTIEIIEHDNDDQVVLESSDEDEVIEVALPPKPTITIESSDEDELTIINPDSPSKNQANFGSKAVSSGERDVSASPAPSAVSSVSDEFIRGDCIALNISSRHPDNPSFDFSLHGSDLLVQSTPSKKKRKKKSKEAVTSTPVVTATSAKVTPNDGCFATPKSKARNKKQKTKLYAVTEKSIPNADIYDSDSNQSIDTNKNRNSYVVTEKSLPSTDVYESDSNLSEGAKEVAKQAKHKDDVSSDSSLSPEKNNQETGKTIKNNDTAITSETFETISIVDLTDNGDRYITIDNINDSDITENIVMGNVSGFTESEDYDDQNMTDSDISKFGSTKIPAILNEDLDFDNLKGKDKICKRRRYSLTTLRAEMEKFYNESWGGENFNHREIQKSMSRDKSLWVIDPKDRMPALAKRKVICNYCNRPGHRDDTCRMKPPVCYMCGLTGHLEPRCPRKICVNCGSPNQLYSSLCRHCCHWGALRCAECGQRGHPASHCPDLWRRYHNTIDSNATLERCGQSKKHHQLYCSGCTRRGHLIHTCRLTLPFSGLPINSPYVYLYRPIYPPTPNTPNINQKKQNRNLSQDYSISTDTTPLKNDRNKRQSKSPVTHETHMNKKRNTMSPCEETERRYTKSPVNTQQKKSTSKDDESKKEANKTPNESSKTQGTTEKAPNFIPLFSPNHDKKGNMIQDNEVSDTSDVITSARIYVTNDIIDKLKTDEGKLWLKETSQKFDVDVQNAEINSFLNIRGKVEDQEGFQAQLRDWAKPPSNVEGVKPSTEGDIQDAKSDQYVSVIPKNRNNLLRQLSKALESLKEDLGDPSALYKELMYLQNRQQNLLKQKVVNPKQVTNNRGHINQMLKRLNMVLLGQAGLADGSEHLNELYSFQEKLMNSRQKNIPTELRKEIGQHYTIIFTSLPRNDYIDLLKMYHNSTQTSLLRKKKKKALKLKPKVNRLQKTVNSIPTQPTQNGGNMELQIGNEEMVAPTNKFPHAVQKLAFYHKRILSTRPTGAALKKTRLDLVRKLHSFIASIFKKEFISSKAWKKIRKTQEQAQLFLSNV